MQQSALRFPQSLDYCSLRREDGDRTKEYGLLRKAKTAFSSCGNGIVLLHVTHEDFLLFDEIAKRGVFLEQGDFCRRQVFIHSTQASRLETRPFRRQQE